MPAIKSIYITALITTILSMLMIGGIIWKRASRKQRPSLLLLFALELPMCALAYYYVREPLLRKIWVWLAVHLDSSLTLATVKQSTLYMVLRVWEAPIAEELAKLWPISLLLIPAVYRYFTALFGATTQLVLVAMSLGLGFGVGEIWFVAHFVALDPAYAGLHWYSFGGFMNERFMVCVCHGAFTAVAVSQIGKGGLRLLLGILGGMCLHFIGNSPILLMKINFLQLGESRWALIVGIHTLVYFLLMIALLTRLRFGNWKMGKFIFGRATCPECRQIYNRPFIGLNAYPKRYEKCSHCKKYHWVDERHDIVEESPRQ